MAKKEKKKFSRTCSQPSFLLHRHERLIDLTWPGYKPFFHDLETAYICIAVRFIVCTLFAQASGEKNTVLFTVRRKAIRLTGTLTGRHGCRFVCRFSFFFFFATYNLIFRKSVRFGSIFGFFKSCNEY